MPSPADLRSGISGLSALAARDLNRLWREVDSAVRAKEALADILPALVATYGLASSTLAADWYDDLRDELNVKGRFSAIVTDIEDLGTDELAGFGVGPLFDANPDWASARTLVEGGVQRRIANAARETVRVSSIEDPRAKGWQRSASGGCAFCQMVASRGIVFSESSADFASHDHCRCLAVPAFDGFEKPVRPYTPTDRDINDADRARVRAYLAEHHAG